eukprot:747644-Hanusia_phi.AAC.1
MSNKQRQALQQGARKAPRNRCEVQARLAGVRRGGLQGRAGNGGWRRRDLSQRKGVSRGAIERSQMTPEPSPLSAENCLK